MITANIQEIEEREESQVFKKSERRQYPLNDVLEEARFDNREARLQRNEALLDSRNATVQESGREETLHMETQSRKSQEVLQTSLENRSPTGSQQEPSP